MDLVGKVEGKTCIIIDDMIDTAVGYRYVAITSVIREHFAERQRSLKKMERSRCSLLQRMDCFQDQLLKELMTAV